MTTTDVPLPGFEAAHDRAGSAPADSPAPGGPHLPYFPGLDGLRGVAVLAVLCFHGGFSWAVGGYLGVSTFFTLSGFLITSLLLAERAGTGRVDLKAFWTRRFRRLMPASLACLLLVLTFGVSAADPVQRANLGGDVVAALAYVANWHFIFSEQSYADLFAAPSPVLHFWSLAIEEQFYLVYPLLMAGLLSVGALAARVTEDKHRFWLHEAQVNYRRTAGIALTALTAGSVALMLFAPWDQNTDYLNTFTRASELLVGGILATLLFDARVTARIARPGPVQRGLVIAGAAALAVSAILWVTTPQTSAWLYEGGLTLYALLSAAVITAAILPVGPVVAGLAAWPLRHLGQISYGVYLYHWPIFLWLRQKTDLAAWPRFLVGVAITLVLAELSFRLLETPIRRGGRVLAWRPLRVAPVAVGVIAAGALVVAATAPPPLTDFGSTQERLAQMNEAAAAEAPSTTIDPASLVPPTPRVAFFGDSTALMTSWGVSAELQTSGRGIPVSGFTGLGCSVIRTDQRRIAGKVEDNDRDCNDWAVNWKEQLDRYQPNVTVVQSGPWDVTDRKLPGDDRWRGPGDPVFDDFLLDEMTAAVDLLSSQGALVVWLTAPRKGPGTTGNEVDEDSGRRIDRYNELVEQLPQVRPGKAAVIDLAGWMDALPPDEDARLRPDGTHFTEDTSIEVARQWLLPELLGTYERWWAAKKTAELSTTTTAQVLVVGDGTAAELGTALSKWSEREGQIQVRTVAQVNCGIGRYAARVDEAGRLEANPDECNNWETLYPIALAGTPPKLVVVHSGRWDLGPRFLPEWPAFLAPGDAAYDAWIREEYTKAADTLHQNGAQVVWLTTAEGDPARRDRLNQIIREVADTRDFVTVVDFAALAAEQGDRDPAEWLAPAILDAVLGRN
jgi:peptidoglycan/LPS O-acetylase OafA/YrhL